MKRREFIWLLGGPRAFAGQADGRRLINADPTGMRSRGASPAGIACRPVGKPHHRASLEAVGNAIGEHIKNIASLQVEMAKSGLITMACACQAKLRIGRRAASRSTDSKDHG
jgi:hypothetical protein